MPVRRKAESAALVAASEVQLGGMHAVRDGQHTITRAIVGLGRREVRRGQLLLGKGALFNIFLDDLGNLPTPPQLL